MSAEWLDRSHECTGEPIIDALTHQAFRGHPGATPDEIIEKVTRHWPAMDSYDRRMVADRVREIVADARRTPKPTVDEIEAKRAELHAAGKYSGTASIARAIGTSESTVKRVLREKR